MDNFIPKGTGNSRLMKSSIPANTTLEQLITMLRSGTFPYDIGEVNEDGIIDRGTPLNKGTLLKDGTADSLGIARSSVPDDALQKLSAAALYGTANGYLKLSQLNDGDVFTLKENGVDVEFIKLGVYDGTNIAVIRKEPLGTQRPFHSSASPFVLYKDSSIDSYLTETYLPLLEDKDVVVETSIEVLSSATSSNWTYETINRKVFLPSLKEWMQQPTYPAENGGLSFMPKTLQYTLARTCAFRPSSSYQSNVFYLLGEYPYAYAMPQDTNGYVFPMFLLPPDYALKTVPVGILKDTLGQMLAINATQIAGGVRIKIGSYIGSGAYGTANPTSIDIGFPPKIVFIGQNRSGVASADALSGGIWTLGARSIYGAIVSEVTDTGMSWYSTQDALSQLNYEGFAYSWIAIGGGDGLDGDTPSLIPPDITQPQEFSDPQKETARDNIGAASAEMVLATFPRKTLASAPIQAFSDGADGIPIKSMAVDVRAVQDLHGQSAPWPAGGGKNKLNPTGTSKTQDGITYTKQSDGRFTATGSNTQTTATACLVGEFAVKSGETYTLSGCPASGSLSSYRLDIRTTPTTLYDNDSTDYGSGYTFTASADATLYVYMRFAYQYAISGTLTFAPMVRLSSVSDATFAPYSNICPISGWDEAQIVGSGKNMLDNKRGSSATTINGVTFTPQSDGSVIVNGTASGGAAIYILWNRTSDSVHLPTGTYTLSGCPSGGSTGTYFMQFQATRSGGLHTYGNETGNGVTATVQDGDILQVTVRVANGATASNLRFYPQLELGSTKTAYEPYVGRTVTMQFGSTVYGGLLEYVGGKEWRFTADRAYMLVDGVNKTIGGIVQGGSGVWYCYVSQSTLPSSADHVIKSNLFAGGTTTAAVVGSIWANGTGTRIAFAIPDQTIQTEAAANTWCAANPVQIVYWLPSPLAPITLTASDDTVTVYGDNVMFADCGDSTLTYRQDIGLVIGG